MFDKDLALIYDVSTGNLNKAVTRNIERFPGDFSFLLTDKEWHDLKFHSGISSWGRTRKRPRVFTEHGILMLSSVLHSRRAAMVNIEIMRVFVKLRRLLETNKDLIQRLDEMEKKYDQQFKAVFEAIRQLMAPPSVPAKQPIGFHVR